jgi:hypothetical protein
VKTVLASMLIDTNLSPLVLGLISFACTAALFGALIALQRIGQRIGAHKLIDDPESSRIATIDGAIFALLGLLIAFTFSAASSRLDARRFQIINESNAIGTAWLRLDLLPQDAQPALRQMFRDYLDARIAGHRAIPDIASSDASFARAASIQGEIWPSALAACARSPDRDVQLLVVPALNEMFDIASTRVITTRMHTPLVIFVVLVLLSMGCAFLVGHAAAAAKSTSTVHTLAFAAALVVTIYVTVDLEFPRAGFIRIDAADQALTDLRESLGAAQAH